MPTSAWEGGGQSVSQSFLPPLFILALTRSNMVLAVDAPAAMRLIGRQRQQQQQQQQRPPYPGDGTVIGYLIHHPALVVIASALAFIIVMFMCRSTPKLPPSPSSTDAPRNRKIPVMYPAEQKPVMSYVPQPDGTKILSRPDAIHVEYPNGSVLSYPAQDGVKVSDVPMHGYDPVMASWNRTYAVVSGRGCDPRYVGGLILWENSHVAYIMGCTLDKTCIVYPSQPTAVPMSRANIQWQGESKTGWYTAVAKWAALGTTSTPSPPPPASEPKRHAETFSGPIITASPVLETYGCCGPRACGPGCPLKTEKGKMLHDSPSPPPPAPTTTVTGEGTTFIAPKTNPPTKEEWNAKYPGRAMPKVWDYIHETGEWTPHQGGGSNNWSWGLAEWLVITPFLIVTILYGLCIRYCVKPHATSADDDDDD